MNCSDLCDALKQCAELLFGQARLANNGTDRATREILRMNRNDHPPTVWNDQREMRAGLVVRFKACFLKRGD